MLEEVIKENTETMKQLIAALVMPGSIPAPVRPKETITTGEAKANLAAGKATLAAPQTTAALDYEKDVKPLVIRIAKEKSREKVVEVLSGFSVTHANQLKPEQWGPFITKCNAALAA